MSKRDWITIALLPAAAIVAPAYATDYLSIPEAQQILFPEARSFKEHWILLTTDQKKQIKSLSGVKQLWDQQKIWRAENKSGFLGWFILDEVIGKHEFINYGVAVSPDGRVLGVEILSYRETHGAQIRSPAWRKHFENKRLSDPFKLNADIPNIGGATLSCRSITNGVKRLLALHKVVLANEPH
jgi:Na+-translocating ferredoxin:NAD+ oxidoreductase RnfG subunit